jgi:hypothetical protein
LYLVALASRSTIMNVHIVFDSSAQSAPAGFQSAVLAAASIIDAALTDNITVNIAVGYGEINGTTLTNQSGAEGNVAGGNLFSYSQVRTLLSNGASTGDTTFASLPSGSSIQGQTQVAVWFAEEKALGLLAANNAATDGYIGIGTSLPSSLWVGAALHEIGHAMGRVPDGPPPNGTPPDIFDLFRFTSAGTRLFASGNTASPAYFSTDGGLTNRADYGQTSDPSDYLNASGRTPEDSFNEFYDSGTMQSLTAVDLEQFDALGFHLAKRVYASTKQDFNSSGTADILWRNSAGALADWDVEGGAIDNGGFLTSNGAVVAPAASWSVAGISDFNGDHKADVLWRDSSGGQLADWFMNGSQIASSGVLNINGTPITPDQSWTVAGIGDLNGDGVSDLLWRNASGSTSVWIMNGASIASSGFLNVNGTVIAPDPTWSVAGMGDFNGDKFSDLLWRNSVTGELAEWQLHSAAIIGAADVNSGGVGLRLDASWSLAGIGDFNGDGDADMLWRNSNGTVAEWLMNGANVIDGSAITFNGSAVNVAANWKVVEIGDFNGDGNSDILWRDSNTGRLDEWFMSGNVLTVSVQMKSNSVAVNPDLSWITQAKPTNFA